ncbi:hypothetical protein F0562_001968 [Nyssa sinensis]|uniref:Uncharacterized protein n=1 Tax=Nyssa sinensis TaxID=561372 RepID=A0A5J5C633_9ASTE|nr:hypothetical protein F0562_001968 [Nyssa sinensis]
MVRKLMISEYDVNLPPEFVTYYYTQTLDHFNYKPESYNTFQQRYIVNSKYWGGANTSSPIFVITGHETDITVVYLFLDSLLNLLPISKHRYYGDSMPFGSEYEAFQNASTLGFFSSTQALADYAQLITDLKRNLSAENYPIIATGRSYGGSKSNLEVLYWVSAQYDNPPDNSVESLCNAIDGAVERTNILGKIAAGLYWHNPVPQRELWDSKE